MSTNIIFAIFSSIIVIALVIYIIAVKKGKSQSSMKTITSEPNLNEEGVENENL